MSRPIKHGSADQSVTIRILDATDGTPEEGVDYDTSGLALWYRRQGGAKTAITPAALTALTDPHADGGIEHVDDGYYRLDVPDGAFASGSADVVIGGSCPNMVFIAAYHPLVSKEVSDLNDLSTTQVNAECDTALSDYDGPTKAELDSGLAGLNDLSASEVNTEVDNALNTAIPGSPTADSINERIKALDDLLQSGGTGDAAAIKDKTDNLPSDPADQSLIIAATDAITTDTEDIQSRLPAALVGGRMSSDAVAISGSTTAADNVEANIGNLDAAVSTRSTVTTNQVNTECDTALADYDPPTKTELDSAFASLNDLSAAEVNAQVVDALGTDTIAQLSQGAPPSTPTIIQALMYLYQYFRNKREQTASEARMYDDAGSTIIAKATLSDNGSTFTKDEFVTGA